MSVSETIAARAAPPMPSRRLIDGPSAWIGANMRKREAEWSYRLSPPEIAEIETALRAVRERGLDIADISREGINILDTVSGSYHTDRYGKRLAAR